MPPEEAQVLTDRARSTAESGPYVPFKDDNLNTYWYNFATKARVMNNPYEKEPDVALQGIDDGQADSW